MDIKRKQAAHLIDEVAMLVAKAKGGDVALDIVVGRLEAILGAHAIPIPTQCHGEAHSNPFIDNCSGCMPNWGWRQQPTKVK